MRKWFRLRAIVYHCLLVAIVTGCSIAAWWQFGRASQGNALSYLYSIEWPVFAIVAIIGWWQLIQEPPEDVEARKEERRRRTQANPVAYDAEVLRQELAAHPELVRQFPQLRRVYPELGAGAGAGGASAEAGAPGGQVQVRAGAEAAETGKDGDEVELGSSRKVQGYNEMLASLSSRGKAKTWRNPRGE